MSIFKALGRYRLLKESKPPCFETQNSKILAEGIRKAVGDSASEIRSLDIWIEKYIDVGKVNKLDREETFKMFALTMLFQGGDAATNKVLQQSQLDEFYPKKIEGRISVMNCGAIRDSASFRNCEYLKSKKISKTALRTSVCYDKANSNCPVKRIGHTVKHMKSSAIAKGVVSIYLTSKERWEGDINNVYRQAISNWDEKEAARHLVYELTWPYNVSDKIANMFCGWMTNPDVIPSIKAWRPGVDWTQFATIDSLVIRALNRMGLAPRNATYYNYTYALREIAKRVDLRKFGFKRFNPLVVETALWMLSRKADGVMQKKDGPCLDTPVCGSCHASNGCKKDI